MPDNTTKIRGAWVANLTWPEAEEHIQSGAVAIWQMSIQDWRYLKTEEETRQKLYCSHADEQETSIMLAIAPDKVNMSRAKPWVRQKMQAGALVLNDKSHSNYSPDGVFGDPTLATKEKGELLLKAMLEDMLELLNF